MITVFPAFNCLCLPRTSTLPMVEIHSNVGFSHSACILHVCTRRAAGQNSYDDWLPLARIRQWKWSFWTQTMANFVGKRVHVSCAMFILRCAICTLRSLNLYLPSTVHFHISRLHATQAQDCPCIAWSNNAIKDICFCAVSTSRSWLGNSHRFTYPAEEV